MSGEAVTGFQEPGGVFDSAKNSNSQKSASNWLAETAFEFASRLFYILMYAVVLLVICMVVLMISTFIYAFMYWVIIPKATWIVPVHFDYRLSGGSRDVVSLKGQEKFDEAERYLQTVFARANVSLISKQWIMSTQVESLHKRQSAMLDTRESYDVSLDMIYQEGRVNDDCGVVNVITDIFHHTTSSSSSAVTIEATSPSEIYGEKGRSVVHLARSIRSFVPTRSTQIVRTVRKLIFLAPLVAGVLQETESHSVRLFEEYVEHGNLRASQVNLEFSGDKLFVSDAQLKFSVKLTGLRWFIKNWFFTSATIGIIQIFLFLMIALLVLYYFMFVATPVEEPRDLQTRTVMSSEERTPRTEVKQTFEREKKE